MAIVSAGCVPRLDHYVDLEPVTDGSFVAKERKTKAKTTATEPDDEGDEIAVRPKMMDLTASKANDSTTPDTAEAAEEPAETENELQEPIERAEQDTSGGLFMSPSPVLDEETPIKTEPPEISKAATVQADVRAADPTPSSLKRPFPTDSISRESTPSKRARISELQARKTAMLAANQERLQRKLAAEKKLEDDRKKREAEEAELLREIAEIEKEGMELDEATEEIEKIWEMENGETEAD